MLTAITFNKPKTVGILLPVLFLPTAQQPPFYSIRMQGWSLVSFAGLGINENFEVIKPSGEPIKNLYAIGEVIGFGATSGNSYVNGMGVTPAITYGKLLGESIKPF